MNIPIYSIRNVINHFPLELSQNMRYIKYILLLHEHLALTNKRMERFVMRDEINIEVNEFTEPNIDRSSSTHNKNPLLKNRKRHIFIFASLSVLLILSISIYCVISYADNLLGKMTQKDTYVSMSDAEIQELLSEELISASDVSANDIMTDEEQAALDKYVSEVFVTEDGLYKQDGVTNILLLGIDTRSAGSMKGRSDVMMILSINENLKQISIVSIMRDSYVNIPGCAPNKINAAYVFGGADLAIKTVERSFGVDIDKYAVVNFYGFMDIINALGGIELDIEQGELKQLNKYIKEINKKQDLPPDTENLYNYGKNTHVTGRQAMGYVRNRYYGNGDYMRTQRQRNVIMAILNKLDSASVSELINVVEITADNTRTDYTSSEILSLATNAPEYLKYDIVQDRLPRDGTFTGGMGHGMWIIQMNFEKNREILREIIYGENAA